MAGIVAPAGSKRPAPRATISDMSIQSRLDLVEDLTDDAGQVVLVFALRDQPPIWPGQLAELRVSPDSARRIADALRQRADEAEAAASE